MFSAPSQMAQDPARHTLAGLGTALTRALQEFLQAHAATISAYAAHWEGPHGPRFEVAHRTLTQEVEHVERFVDTLRTDLARILKELSQLDIKQPRSPS
jgi:uncharacterized protein YukE